MTTRDCITQDKETWPGGISVETMIVQRNGSVCSVLRFPKLRVVDPNDDGVESHSNRLDDLQCASIKCRKYRQRKVPTTANIGPFAVDPFNISMKLIICGTV